MNVVHLCLSPGVGGLEMYPHKVMLRMRDAGTSCHAIVTPDTLLADRLKDDGLDASHLISRRRLFPIGAARRLARMLDDLEADILHMHWAKDLDLAVLAKRFCRRPLKLVYTRQMNITRPKHDFYHRFLYRHVDRFIVISEKLKEDARRFLPMPPENIVLLYYGVAEPGHLSPDERDAFLIDSGLTQDGFSIGLFARIQHIKGQHLLLEALNILNDRGVRAQAVLAGSIMDQPYFDDLMRRRKELGLEDRFLYIGFLSAPGATMRCLDALALTTYNETFGLAIAEAMRAGTAVIGTNAGGVPDMIREGETGLLFEPGNAAQLADAIASLVADPGRRSALAEAGKAFADKHFSEEQHFEGLDEIYRDVLGE